MVKFDDAPASKILGRAASAVASMDMAYYQRSDNLAQEPSQPRKTRMEYEHMAGKVLKQAPAHTEWSGARSRLNSLMENPVYSGMMGLVIVANTILVIHETDLRASGPGFPGWIHVISNIFLSIYIIELAVRFYIYRTDFFRNAWNWLDLIIVITDCLQELAKAGGLDELPSVSVLRIFRLMRLVRLIAMLAVFQELQTMLLGFGSAMKAIMWASLMIGVVITVCSIIAVMAIHPLNVEVAKTGVYGDCERCGRAFETVAESNLTFIQQIIAGDSWGMVTIPIIEAYPAAGVFFLIVFGVIDLGVINLVLMVIVNAAESAREANEDIQFRKKVRQIEEMKNRLKNICKSLDGNEDGRLSLQEFMDGFDHNEELERTMAALDIQRQDAELIFFLMDEDESGDVDFHEFIGLMVGTKHESLSTKLLFLKAGLHQLQQNMDDHRMILKEDVVPKMMSFPEIAQCVDTAINEASAKTGLKWDKFMSECQGLVEKLDQRWGELQMDQAKNCQQLEKVVGEMLLPLSRRSANRIQPELQANAPESTLSSLSMPSACAPHKLLEESVSHAAPSASIKKINCEKGFNVAEHSPASSWDISNLKLYKTKRCGD